MLSRSGYSTGTCAAAAAKAATVLLAGGEKSKTVEVSLPDGERAKLTVVRAELSAEKAMAAVRKTASNDPDATASAEVIADVRWVEGSEVLFRAGEGVGTVTKPGLSIPPGEPAINPVPRQMIYQAVREITDHGLEVVLSITGGEAIAAKTFNPKLGIKGGLSILGTTGRVRPFSIPALRESLRCAINVKRASGETSLVLVPGHIGERAALRHYKLTSEQIVEVSNEWGFVLDLISEAQCQRLLAVGHPGKLAKLIEGDWDTHSARSQSAVPIISRLCKEVLHFPPPASPTVEGIFRALAINDCQRLAEFIAQQIGKAISKRLKIRPYPHIAVALINMSGELLGSNREADLWR